MTDEDEQVEKLYQLGAAFRQTQDDNIEVVQALAGMDLKTFPTKNIMASLLGMQHQQQIVLASIGEVLVDIALELKGKGGSRLHLLS